MVQLGADRFRRSVCEQTAYIEIASELHRFSEPVDDRRAVAFRCFHCSHFDARLRLEGNALHSFSNTAASPRFAAGGIRLEFRIHVERASLILAGYFASTAPDETEAKSAKMNTMSAGPGWADSLGKDMLERLNERENPVPAWYCKVPALR